MFHSFLKFNRHQSVVEHKTFQGDRQTRWKQQNTFSTSKKTKGEILDPFFRSFGGNWR
jgi:hypothetical protein